LIAVAMRSDALGGVGGEHLDLPGLALRLVDPGALLEGLVEFDLSDDGAQGGLGEVHGGKALIGDAVAGPLGVHHLEIQDAVHGDGDVVLGDALLLGHVQGLFLEGLLEGDPVNERDENVKAGVQR
jgi:hypothetical protein